MTDSTPVRVISYPWAEGRTPAPFVEIEPPVPLDPDLTRLGVNLVQTADKDPDAAIVQTVRTALELIDIRRETRRASSDVQADVHAAYRQQHEARHSAITRVSHAAIEARRGYLGDPEDPDVETRVPGEVLRVLRAAADQRRVSTNQLMRDVLTEWAAQNRKADQ